MSFDIVKLENWPFLSKGANEFLSNFFSKLVPRDVEHFELDALRNLEIPPTIGPSSSQAILHLKTRVDDIFVCGLPKSGSNWMQNIVWLLTHGLDYGTNRSVSSKKLMCNLDDFTKLKDVKGNINEFSFEDFLNERFESVKLPRVFKSHCSLQFLPKQMWSNGAKLIYVVRNPKDQVVSEYHFLRNVFHADLTMDDIVNGITSDMWIFCPRFNHVLNYWRIRHLPNVCFIAYEDLVNDTFDNIKKLSEFLNCQYSDEQLQTLTEYSSFENMKKIETINRESDVTLMENLFGRIRPDAEFRFMRKGKVGSYQEELNEDQIKKLDDWIENGLKCTDFRFQE